MTEEDERESTDEGSTKEKADDDPVEAESVLIEPVADEAPIKLVGVE